MDLFPVLFFGFWLLVGLIYVVSWISGRVTKSKRRVRGSQATDDSSGEAQRKNRAVRTAQATRDAQEAEGRETSEKESAQASDSEPDAELYKALKRWRNRTAKVLNVRPYKVLYDRALKPIVERKPATKTGLRYIPGVGPRRAERYGAAILSLVAPQERDRKKEWRQLKKAIESESIRVLYHFTDQANLSSILCSGGLYSWSHCERNGIRISRPGGNQASRRLDRQRGLEDYVRLSFVKEPPMYHVAKRDGRIQNPVILEVRPEVILWEQTKFSDGNATANRARIGGKLEDFRQIRFDILRKSDWADEYEKHYWQAEVLVKNHIPLRYIRNL